MLRCRRARSATRLGKELEERRDQRIDKQPAQATEVLASGSVSTILFYPTGGWNRFLKG